VTERRYKEEEVRKIFELANERGVLNPHKPATSTGLTLTDIQNVGREVGIDPEQIARAAAVYDARAEAKARRTSFGMPIEVGHSVALPRVMNDLEWEQLVAELRSTFKASGKINVQGNLREWRNGNLYASVEPTAAGARLRMGTLKSDATGINMLGATGVAAGAISYASLAAAAELTFGTAAAAGVFAIGGIAAFAINLARLPSWARQRSRQMQHIGSAALAIVGRRIDDPNEPKDETT
jgi:hypothetical protein